MFEIVSKTGDLFDVLDTSDGVVESVSYLDIVRHMSNGIEIGGVSFDGTCYHFDIDNTYVKPMMKGYKFRLYPNKEQEVFFQKTFGCCRKIWNLMLSDKIKYYEENGKMLATYPSDYKDEYPYLKEVDSRALASVYLNLNIAFRNFFSREEVGYPRFKSKHDRHQSYTTYNDRNTVYLSDRHVRLPKIGKVRVKVSQPVLGTIKNATVSCTPSGKYYISFNVCIWMHELPKSDKNIGLDLGIKNLIVTSDGELYENQKTYYKYEKRLKREQRKLSKKQKGSKSREKQRKIVARYHEKVANIRKDNLHKISNSIVRENQIIVGEDLNIRGMQKNHRLAKSISDVSWYELTRQLEYKSAWYGREYIKIDRWYPSSQTCSCCGYVNKEVKNLGIRDWVCPECNSYHDRDVNAARNILAEGLKKVS